jgi:hypothetical protein
MFKWGALSQRKRRPHFPGRQQNGSLLQSGRQPPAPTAIQLIERETAPTGAGAVFLRKMRGCPEWEWFILFVVYHTGGFDRVTAARRSRPASSSASRRVLPTSTRQPMTRPRERWDEKADSDVTVHAPRSSGVFSPLPSLLTSSRKVHDVLTDASGEEPTGQQVGDKTWSYVAVPGGDKRTGQSKQIGRKARACILAAVGV